MTHPSCSSPWPSTPAAAEPVFAHTKDIRGIRGFTRRGLTTAQAEWQLIAGTHNLLKLYRARPAPA